jgi:hypothetical protein
VRGFLCGPSAGAPLCSSQPRSNNPYPEWLRGAAPSPAAALPAASLSASGPPSGDVEWQVRFKDPPGLKDQFMTAAQPEGTRAGERGKGGGGGHVLFRRDAAPPIAAPLPSAAINPGLTAPAGALRSPPHPGSSRGDEPSDKLKRRISLMPQHRRRLSPLRRAPPPRAGGAVHVEAAAAAAPSPPVNAASPKAAASLPRTPVIPPPSAAGSSPAQQRRSPSARAAAVVDGSTAPAETTTTTSTSPRPKKGVADKASKAAATKAAKAAAAATDDKGGKASKLKGRQVRRPTLTRRVAK